jgi:cytochrome d ubiquinol oxidase subunit II
MDLQVLWFVLLGVLLTGYVVLDGFDLGVGILHLCARREDHRRMMMSSIAPVWDGNEVWLVAFGGALFAAFPEAYATAFSAFYLPFMLLLFSLICRAVSLEFRGKRQEAGWRTCWDTGFWAGSWLAAFLLGVAAGNMVRGIPVGPNGEFQGSLPGLLHPYCLLVGLLTPALFALHGALYLNLKTAGDLQQQVRRWAWRALAIFAALYLAATLTTLAHVPRALSQLRQNQWAFSAPALSVLALAGVAYMLRLGRPGWAFACSCLLIASLSLLFGLTLFPDLVVSSLNPDQWSLTIRNASSSQRTLFIMCLIALIGMPLGAAYNAVVYWVFRGKVKPEEVVY